MRLFILTVSVYLVLTGIRLFTAAILEAVHGGCQGCPYRKDCRQETGRIQNP